MTASLSLSLYLYFFLLSLSLSVSPFTLLMRALSPLLTILNKSNAFNKSDNRTVTSWGIVGHEFIHGRFPLLIVTIDFHNYSISEIA